MGGSDGGETKKQVRNACGQCACGLARQQHKHAHTPAAGRCAHRRPRLLHGGGVAWRAVWAAADMSARGRRHTHCYLRKKKVMSMGRAMMMIGTRGVVLRASDRRGENDRRACTDMRTNGVSVGVGWVGGTEKSYEACPLCQLAPQDEHTGSRSTRRDGRQKMRRARGCAGRRCV